MALNLDTLSPKELQALIANAQSQMHTARAGQVKDVRSKIDALLHSNGLTLADVYPTRGGKGSKGGTKNPVAPKYRNPDDASQTWSGRGKRPLWFIAALKRRGVTAENLLIAGASKAPAPAKKTAAKPTKKAVKAPAKKAVAKKKAAKR
ncbi:H-NS family nucleoid-associated regulatory protein [Dyella tabacisoli]|uniref:H-NS histone family protein n=1 Tax=Dyella tabacisoli TaxID=2282381 RepID=A0A369UR33_9GAMM|nr:H-NS histone family protein [Dyella tabacisoli]RDD83224.1 H-NS histone family protein [Dyella tabacisoli]